MLTRLTVPAPLACALRAHLREAQRDYLRDPVVVHGNAVEHVGRLDGAAVVRDEHELRAVGELSERLREPADVALVERGVDLVEHAEGRGPYTQDREQQGRRGKRALAAGELVEASDPLARGPRVDLDARLLVAVRFALSARAFVARPERRLAAVEQPLEEEPELAVDRLQRRAELFRDRPGEIVSERPQVSHRPLEIGLLTHQEVVALPDVSQ